MLLLFLFDCAFVFVNCFLHQLTHSVLSLSIFLLWLFENINCVAFLQKAKPLTQSNNVNFTCRLKWLCFCNQQQFNKGRKEKHKKNKWSVFLNWIEEWTNCTAEHLANGINIFDKKNYWFENKSGLIHERQNRYAKSLTSESKQMWRWGGERE